MNAADSETPEDPATAAGRSRRSEMAAHHSCLVQPAPDRSRGRAAREDFAGLHSVRVIVAAVSASAPIDRMQDVRRHRRYRVVLGVPWVLVLLHVAALIVSAMAGLALALFA